MPDEKNNSSDDGFWDLSNLLPQKPRGGVNAPIPRKLETVKVEFDTKADGDFKSVPIVNPYTATAKTEEVNIYPDYSYSPQNEFISACTIQVWPSKFALYNDFIIDAKKYYTKTCIGAKYVYFFSYRTKYSELNHEQLCWYLFWRSRMKAGEFLKTGLSYIFLYLYELINISEIIGEQKTLDMMTSLWLGYRAEFPRIDKYIADWIIDFCLINKLQPDFSRLEPILPDILGVLTLREYFLGKSFFTKRENIGLVMKYFSEYDYTSGKYYTEENKQLFDLHINEILFEVIKSEAFTAIIDKEINEGPKIKLMRESYMGAICAYSKKRRIIIDYRPIFKNYAITRFVTNTIRVAQNAVHSYLKIKSRLSLNFEPDEATAGIISRYSAINIPPPIKEKKQANNSSAATIEEEVYEFKPTLETAAGIEKSSWETTIQLVKLQERDAEPTETPETDIEFEQEFEEEKKLSADIATDKSQTQKPQIVDEYAAGFPLVNALSPLETSIIIAALTGADTAELSKIAQNAGQMIEFLIDSINEKAVDSFGDIIFSTASITIDEAYTDDLSAMFGL